ncbi:MAG: radical SAM protein [Microbacteriaceae bacterium]|nr:radical SAM protein [Microbacteriaceae bacterium]NBS61245.1 radical SAM protein [Microbacteriaceae bacterium]
MAIFVATDFSVSINGSTALASYLTQVELKTSATDITTTAFGSSWVTRVGGLREGSLTLTFNQDYAASTVDATLWPLLGSNATVVIKPTSSAVGTANPAYTAICVVNDLTPVSGTVGDLATFSVTWPTTGTVSRATA